MKKVVDYLDGLPLQIVEENRPDLYAIKANIFSKMSGAIYRSPIHIQKPLHIHFLDAEGFNARAASCEDGDVILLNTLSPKFVLGAWRGILSHMNSYIPFGKSLRYKGTPENISLSYQDWDFAPLAVAKLVIGNAAISTYIRVYTLPRGGAYKKWPL